MPLLATSWAVGLNPIGPWSIGGALICGAVWRLVDRRWPPTQRHHAWLMLLAPLLLIAFVAWSKVQSSPLAPLFFRYHWGRYRFPNAQDYVADYIFVAVAVLLAWKTTRLSFRDLRLVGFLELALALAFLGLEASLLYEMFRAM